MKAVVGADIRQGKLDVSASARAALQEAVLTWPDGPVTITIARESVTRSAAANAYYWGCVIKALADHTGYTADEMHDVLKVKFLPKDVAIARQNGEVVAEFVIGGSTTKLEIGEFADYTDRIRMWAFEALDVSIPPGDPAWRLTASDPVTA